VAHQHTELMSEPLPELYQAEREDVHMRKQLESQLLAAELDRDPWTSGPHMQTS
jgi:hypothetical protein